MSSTGEKENAGQFSLLDRRAEDCGCVCGWKQIEASEGLASREEEKNS